MNKFKLMIVVFVFIIIFCFIGAFFVQADTEIKQEEDILEIQNVLVDSIDVYGYTIDNPNVIVDPYGENYNSALIMFETDDYVSISVNVNDIYSYNSNESNRHYIGVYNLLVGSNNVVLSYGNVSKKIEINIEEGENSLDLEKSTLLSNNHYLVPTDKYISNGFYTGIREVDALGKIYYEYLLEDGYRGIACEIDDEKFAVLGNKVIILDRQNGSFVSSYDISSYGNDWVGMEYINGNLIVYGNDKNIFIDVDGNITYFDGNYEKKYLSGDINYKSILGIRFFEKIVTKKSDKNVWLLNYSDEMKNKIEIKREFNRIIVSSEEIDNCNTYLILDQLLDKRVYELCDSENYIYTYDFEGKYSVYFKIDDEVYKTNKYLDF